MEGLTPQIRVANIIEDGRLAGPHKRIMMVATALNKVIETSIILPKKNSKQFQSQCEALNIKYLTLSLTTMTNNWANIIRYLALFPFEILILSWTLKKKHFDLVHVSGGCWQFKGVIAARLANIKVIWHLNDTYAPNLIRSIFSFISPLANGFIFASESTKQYYSKLIPAGRQNFLIQSPVDVKLFDPEIQYKSKDLPKKIVVGEKIIIGTVGNVNRTKGHTTFLKAVKKLSNYSNDIIFLIVGPVYKSQIKYFKYLVNIIKVKGIKNVYFIDSKKDVRPLLKVMDIYVCSSDNEASPLSVWEAMSMEKAIVSTDVGDVKKFIQDGMNGYIVKKADADGLADRIAKLIERPEIRRNFGKSARAVVKSKLDLKICAQLHSEAYRAIILQPKNFLF